MPTPTTTRIDAPSFPREVTAAVLAHGVTWWDIDPHRDPIGHDAFVAWCEYYEYGRVTDRLWDQFVAEVLEDLPAEPIDDEDLHPGDLVTFTSRRHAVPGATEGRVARVHDGRCGMARCPWAKCVEVTVRHHDQPCTISIDASNLAKVAWSRFDPYTGAQVHGLRSGVAR